MSRVGRVITTLRVPCRTASPLHVGTGQTNPFTDSPCQRDASGRLVIPGSSIAGSVRTLVGRLYGERTAEDLFGCLGDAEDQGSASSVWVFDAVLGTESTEIRDGVGINRATMGPAGSVKFDLEVVPSGTPLDLRFMIEGDSAEDARERASLLLGAVKQVAEGLWPVGGRTSRGFGWLSGDPGDIEFRVFDLAAASDAVRLASQGPWGGEPVDFEAATASSLASPVDVPPCAVRVRMKARVKEPIAVGGRFKRDETDIAPVLTAVSPDGELSYVVPGSTLKGALRSRVEEILRRTQGAGAACDPTAGPRTDTPSCTSRLDGALKKATPQQVTEWVARNACFACKLFGMGHWRSSVAFKDALIVGGATKKFDWVAIDRFTGAPGMGRGGKKFDGSLLTGGEFDFELLITEDRTGSGAEEAWLALLAHLLLDLETDGLQLGFGKMRGWGHCDVEVTSIEVGAAPSSPLATFEGPLGEADDGIGWSTRALDWQAFKSLEDPQAAALRARLDGALAGWLGATRGGELS